MAVRTGRRLVKPWGGANVEQYPFRPRQQSDIWARAVRARCPQAYRLESVISTQLSSPCGTNMGTHCYVAVTMSKRNAVVPYRAMSRKVNESYCRMKWTNTRRKWCHENEN